MTEAAGTPAFVAPFDLLTTADVDVRQKVTQAPGYGWWGRLLRWRTTFVGTTVSEYALFHAMRSRPPLLERCAMRWVAAPA